MAGYKQSNKSYCAFEQQCYVPLPKSATLRLERLRSYNTDRHRASCSITEPYGLLAWARRVPARASTILTCWFSSSEVQWRIAAPGLCARRLLLVDRRLDLLRRWLLKGHWRAIRGVPLSGCRLLCRALRRLLAARRHTARCYGKKIALARKPV